AAGARRGTPAGPFGDTRPGRGSPPIAGDPPGEVVAAAASALSKAKRPLIMIGRVSSDENDWKRRVALAERLGARVLTDLKTGASFPTTHPLHCWPPGLFIPADAAQSAAEADVILSLDWIDLGARLSPAPLAR